MTQLAIDEKGCQKCFFACTIKDGWWCDLWEKKDKDKYPCSEFTPIAYKSVDVIKD